VTATGEEAALWQRSASSSRRRRVRPERLKPSRSVARLDREFAYRFHVEAVLWEREPLVATRHFQDPDNIPPRAHRHRRGDPVSRLGVPLPAEERFPRGVGASRDRHRVGVRRRTRRGARPRGVPHLLLYRKTAADRRFGDRAAVQQRLEQLDLSRNFSRAGSRAPTGRAFPRPRTVCRDCGVRGKALRPPARAAGRTRWRRHGRSLIRWHAPAVPRAPIATYTRCAGVFRPHSRAQ